MKSVGKWIGRIVVGILAVAVVLVVLVAGAVVIDGFSGPARLDAIVNTRIPNAGGPEVRAYVARPSTPGPGKYPAVILIHEFWGLTPEIIGKAEALAQEGYVVVAPDTFRGSTTSLLPRAIFQVISNKPEQVDGDLTAVFDWLSAQPDVEPGRVAIAGFCYGGTASIRYAVNNPKIAATAVFYGTPVVDAAKLKALGGPVLGVFGGADASIPLSEVSAFETGLTEAGVKHEITVYDGQPHAFVRSIEEIRQGGVQQQAWNQLLAFLKGSLQAGAPASHVEVQQRADDAPTVAYLIQLALAHLGTTHTH